MKPKTEKTVFSILISLILILACGGGLAANADGDKGTDFYVAFSHQNYSVRNANKMTLSESGEFLLENVPIPSSSDFYVTDGSGARWLGADGKNIKTDETGIYDYTVKFSPDRIYSETADGFAATDCHVTYAFFTPAKYSVDIGSESAALVYNPYFTEYDLYYISCMNLSGGTAVSYNGETHVIAHDGAYRILFTPGETRSGSIYKFDANGRYGSGDGYEYNLYIEDAAEYFVVFSGGAANIDTDETPVSISGADAYPLTRYEKNTAAAEYRFGKLFLSERDGSVKYAIYERVLGDKYYLIDDDNDENTALSRLSAADPGWYALSLTAGTNVYSAGLEKCSSPLKGWYAVGEFNGFGFDANGNTDADPRFGFRKVETDDEDYNEDYEQYVLYINVGRDDLTRGDVEFYITDGIDSYKNGTGYIALNTAGKYKILFSEEHVYSLGRHYRYTLTEETRGDREIEISSAEEFAAFALACSDSADYSLNLSVYLTCDIDFAGKEFIPVKTFGGKFFGGYHSLINITLKKGSASVFGLVTRSGSIERLNAENLVIDDKDENYVGFVGKNYGELSKITVSGSVTGGDRVGGITGLNGISRIDDDSATVDSDKVVQTGVCRECVNLAAVSGKSNTGGIAGFNSGDILSCENNGNIFPFTADSSANLTNIGGIAGFSAGKISDCINNASVGTASYSVYTGGIAGFCTGENYFCANNGTVTGRRYSGGIIGGYGAPAQNESGENGSFGSLSYAEIINRYFSSEGDGDAVLTGARHNLVYLQNYGNITADNHAAGVLALCNYDGITIENSLSVGDVITTSGGYAGGILGRGRTTTIVSSFSSGTVKASGSGANYVGGIAGLGNAAQSCMSNAALFGLDYVGGIAGYISGNINSCYTFTAIVCDGDFSGGIAGYAESYNESMNSFPDGFAYNYYIGSFGGIAGIRYSENFEFAASRIEPEKLLSEDGLSPYLHENFSHEHWQGGGKNSFPVLRYMTECKETEDTDDEEELFAKHSELLGKTAAESAKQSFTVVFMEWNKDNGDLYDGNEIQYVNFDEILTVKAVIGATVSAEPKYASRVGGKFVYTGGGKNYFVSFPLIENVRENTVVYAVYRESASTLSAEDGTVLAEGLFDAETQLKLIRIGEYYGLEFYLNGEKTDVENYTVKFRIPNAKKTYAVFSADETPTEIESEIYGGYLRFVSNGELFKITEKAEKALSPLEITLICLISVLVAAAVITVSVTAAKRRKKKTDKE